MNILAKTKVNRDFPFQAEKPSQPTRRKKKGGKKSKATTIVVSEPLEPELLQILDKVLDTPEEDDEELEVDAITYDGVDYLLDTNTNEVYNMDSELVGKMNGNELILF